MLRSLNCERAVSRPNFASKYYCCNICRDLQIQIFANIFCCTAKNSKLYDNNIAHVCTFCKSFRNFPQVLCQSCWFPRRFGWKPARSITAKFGSLLKVTRKTWPRFCNSVPIAPRLALLGAPTSSPGFRDISLRPYGSKLDQTTTIFVGQAAVNQSTIFLIVFNYRPAP